ncbi:chromosome partitioning protein ParB [Polaromonas sp.]|nr:chromosome partitioning protein ParB [Polaromonas sp.]
MKSEFLMRALLLGLALLMGCSAALAAKRERANWSGVVSHVVDGDTVKVRPAKGGKPISIRIEGIDAPEICQTGGRVSRDALKRRVLGKRVAVHGKTRDKYGRLVARIVLKGEDQGRWMVNQGQAWSYRHGRSDGPYAAEQRRAKAAKRGVFAKNQARGLLYPADFRKKHGSCGFAAY